MAHAVTPPRAYRRRTHEVSQPASLPDRRTVRSLNGPEQSGGGDLDNNGINTSLSGSLAVPRHPPLTSDNNSTMTDHGDVASRLTLRGSVQAPRYVFGTGGIFEPGPIHHALKEGYLAFDTAQQYNNEREVGEAIRSYPGQVDRKDLFIISKVASPGSTVEETLQGIRQSVEKIGLGGYVDLFLIHNPNFGPEGRKNEWLALELAKKEGLVRAIGVSNYVVRHLETMKEYASEMPAVNQIELSPFNQDPEVAAYCAKEGIQLQAFASVVRGAKSEDPVLLAIAKEVGKNWNKVLLRWAWQRGFMVTCKSATPSRITDNIEIFDFSLSKEQMTRLDGLECCYRCTPRTVSEEERKVYYVNMP